MGQYKDLIGKKFGKLLVISKADYKKNNKIVYVCQCDCGNKAFVKACNLTRTTRPTRSCGCIHKELNKTRGIKHNMRYNRIYGVWCTMNQRCSNPNYKGYKYYGGRGIKVCDEWKHNPQSFFEWAFDNGYNEHAKTGDCTIDRINVNGDYEPDNCRWVNMKIQASNKRKRHVNH